MEERTPQLVTVFGPAGVGKSRLLREFVGKLGPQAIALRGRCLSYGDGITFWPLAEVTRQAAGIAEASSLEEAGSKLTGMLGEEEREVADRVAAAIGLSTEPFPLQETFWAAKRLFEILSGTAPLAVLVDDIHWAEPAFLDLIRFVVDSAADAPFVFICSSRRELLETHPLWAEERANARTVTLQPLSGEEISLVVENHLGAVLDAAARTRIIAASGGNPLFVEQLLSMLIDEGALRPAERGGWVLAREARFSIPPSIHALLTARLDLLGQADRVVIERAAVAGQTFFRGAVEELVPESIRDHVGVGLLTLERKELIRPDESTLVGHEAFRFLHILIQDAAYRGLLKRTRAELHERFVDWVERQASDRVAEFEEIRGYHLEQAYLILSQLGTLDDHAREVGARGAQYLSFAGDRALARGDLHAAASLLGRAAVLLEDDDPSRPRLLLHAGEALFEGGEFSDAGAKLAEAANAAAATGDRGLETTARMSRRQLRYATEGGASDERVGEELEATIATLEEIGDHEGLARAWRFLADVRWAGCRYGAAEEAAMRTIEHARLAGDHVMEVRILPALAALALWGPMTAPDALALSEEVLEEAAGDMRAEALTLRAMAHLEAMLGRFDQARERYRRSRAILEELGWTLQAALTSINSGAVEMLAGDLSAAEHELRNDFLTLERMGERNFISTTAGFLADVLYQLGRYEEAQELSTISEEVAAPEDVSSQSLWRCVRAKVIAREGRLDEAEALARDGVSIIGGSDDPNSHGNALMDLAEVLGLAGKREEAVAAAKGAAELFAQKGNLVSAARARAVLDELIQSGLR